MPVRVRAHKRRRAFYVRGIDKKGAVHGIVVEAGSRKEARGRFRKIRPKDEIIWVNQRWIED